MSLDIRKLFSVIGSGYGKGSGDRTAQIRTDDRFWAAYKLAKAQNKRLQRNAKRRLVNDASYKRSIGS